MKIRLPAEWEAHDGTWIAWHFNPENWRAKTDAIKWSFAEMIRAVADREKARLIINVESERDAAQTALAMTGVNLTNVEFYPFPVYWGWLRDCGPQFIFRDSRLEIIDFQFNAWANYDRGEIDNAIPAQIAKYFSLALTAATRAGKPWTLEGGAIDSNGDGAILTTEECLLDQQIQVRNRGFSRADNEKILRDYLGVETVIWLKNGLSGDDTHGHVDDLARFVKPRTVAAVCEKNPRDENYRALAENWERLRAFRFPDAGKLEIIELPAPPPVLFHGQRLPASYANFYLCNGAVLVPTFDVAEDRAALGIIADIFPDREIIGIYARDLIVGGGAIHCLTMQHPA